MEEELVHHFALFEGHIVNIKDIEKPDNTFAFECPYCKAPMYPTFGDKQQHHFRHMPGWRCDYKDYLHSMAELVIRDWMNITDQIPIIIDEKANCENYYNCIIRKEYENPTCIGIFRKWETIQVYSDI